MRIVSLESWTETSLGPFAVRLKSVTAGGECVDSKEFRFLNLTLYRSVRNLQDRVSEKRAPGGLSVVFRLVTKFDDSMNEAMMDRYHSILDTEGPTAAKAFYAYELVRLTIPIAKRFWTWIVTSGIAAYIWERMQ